uniref:Protein cab-1 n=1 Tax=Parascaris univalens TaxID=6257 RepID=A0A915C185_PARUN
MWQPLLPALLLIHISWATLFSEGGPQELYYPDEEYIPRGNVQYDPDKLAEVIEQLNKDVDLQRERTRAVFDQDDLRTKAMEIELARSVEEAEKPMSAQKKGQSEFVEFIEPKAASQLKQAETLGKRIPVPQDTARQSSTLIQGGNFFFIAVAAVCTVGAVAGAVSGAHYYRTWRVQQAAAQRSDFTHYAPAGPGKDKKKKRGDESLAYKAQLHHYQQTKQKIISGEELGAGMPDNDETSEASDDEGNNFSVYECPGLAPTGDIEVQNPNFDSRP